MVKAVAINSSPRMDKGNTAMVLNPFVDGMRDAGAEVELLYTAKLNIKPCSGEFKCWGGTPGKCHIRDDMDMVLPKLRDAELWVLGIPLYVPMPGEMQNLLNRTMPLFDGSIEVKGKRMFPHRREEFKLKKLALVSSCAYWEMENFTKLTVSVEETAEAFQAEYAGAALRPHAEVLKRMIKTGQDVSGIIGAAREAGSELVRKEKMSKETLNRVSAPLVTFEEYLRNYS